jgi:hypothetical protein
VIHHLSRVSVQGSDRGAFERITAKMTEAPGPGYYNYRSEFDLPEEAGGNSYADTNFLMQLNAARKRQSAVFESRTARDALMQEVKRRQGEPGPGSYDLGTSIKAESKPEKVQNFASSGARFQDVSHCSCVLFGVYFVSSFPFHRHLL